MRRMRGAGHSRAGGRQYPPPVNILFEPSLAACPLPLQRSGAEPRIGQRAGDDGWRDPNQNGRSVRGMPPLRYLSAGPRMRPGARSGLNAYTASHPRRNARSCRRSGRHADERASHLDMPVIWTSRRLAWDVLAELSLPLSLTDAAVDPLPKQVRVAAVAGVLL